MRLLFVNRFYWPETPATGQLLTDLAEFMARSGHDVSVICSHPANPLAGEEVHRGVRIYRARGTRSRHGGLLGKTCDFASFYLNALLHLIELTDRDTIVIVMTDPPLMGIGAWLVTTFRRARLIHWVQDIYPELAIELAAQPWLRTFRPLRDLAWRHAACCVTLGSDMASVLEGAGVPAAQRRIISNWAPEGLSRESRTMTNPLRVAWGLAGKFVVGYSGNLGRVHDLESILAVADAMREDRDIIFVFIGGGAQRAALEAEARRRQLSNVSFHAATTRDTLPETLALADVHLVTLRSGCEQLVFPSKLYGVAAVGRPVLFVGPPASEIAQAVASNGMGLVAASGDVAGIVAAIYRLKDNASAWAGAAEAAVTFAATHNFAVASAQWRSVVEQVGHCQAVALESKTVAAQ